MGPLFVVEIRRFLARRTVRLVALAVIAAIAAGGVITFAVSRRPTPEDEARARAQRALLVQSCVRGDFGIREEDVPEGQTLEEFCEQVVGETSFGPDEFRLSALPEVFQGTTFPLFMLAWLLGASFVGAEWHAGTVATLLTWETRRVRVIVAKATVAVALVFVGAILLQSVLGLALWPAASFRGSTAGLDAAWTRETAGVLLRCAAVCALGSIMGLALAMVARNTAAALGVGFGYLIVFEQVLSAIRPGWRPWLLITNIGVVVSGDPTVLDVANRSVVEAALILTAYAGILMLTAGLLFRARDVT